MSEALKVIYHNVLSDLGHEEDQIAYFHALQDTYEPDVMFLTEFRDVLRYTLAPHKFTVNYEPAIDDKNHGKEGIAVVSRFKPEEVDITRRQSWKGKPIDNLLRHDARDIVRVEVPFDLGRLAIFAGHIFHPHHLHYPSFGATRPKQWRHLRDMLGKESLPFAYLADTNTMFASSVKRGLRVNDSRTVLLPHTGNGNQRTWRLNGRTEKILRLLTGQDMPDLLYLDRAAVRNDIASFSTLETVPSVVQDIKNPSDHRPILLTINSAT